MNNNYRNDNYKALSPCINNWSRSCSKVILKKIVKKFFPFRGVNTDKLSLDNLTRFTPSLNIVGVLVFDNVLTVGLVKLVLSWLIN